MTQYQRPQTSVLAARLKEPVRWIHIVAGPRQVGKTTLVRSVLGTIPSKQRHYVSVDPAGISARSMDSAPSSESLDSAYPNAGAKPNAAWLIRQWESARRQATQAGSPFVLAIDEIQKIPRWSDTVKGLWDEDRAADLSMHVILLGSSPLLMQDGLSESLMGRFEMIRMGHWSYEEMHTAFGLSLDEYIYFGGYPEPVASGLYRDEPRWREHVIHSLIEPSIDQDVLAMSRIDRPALLKQLFWLGCGYSGQILALDNMAENLREKNENAEAHTGTIAKYLDLLGKAGLVTGLQKYSGSLLRQRTSSPKLQALNNALMAVASGYDFAAAKADRSQWGRMVESAVGAHLHNSGDPRMLSYWRKGKREVDFVLSRGDFLTAIEVKSGRGSRGTPGLNAFATTYGGSRQVVVGGDGVPLVEFLTQPPDHWIFRP